MLTGVVLVYKDTQIRIGTKPNFFEELMGNTFTNAPWGQGVWNCSEQMATFDFTEHERAAQDSYKTLEPSGRKNSNEVIGL